MHSFIQKVLLKVQVNHSKKNKKNQWSSRGRQDYYVIQ